MLQAAESAGTDILLARQPIYDRAQRCVAYELLFRTSDGRRPDHLDGDAATTQVILNTFLEAGLDRVVGKRKAYLNLTRPFLNREVRLPFPPGRVALEVLEDIEVDRPLLESVANLRDDGYTIVLDDFVFRESLVPLVELAETIKIDVLALPCAAVAEHAKRMKAMGKRLLAEKIETPEAFRAYRDMGFDLFQGYFLARPDLVRGRRMPANRTAALSLLAKLQDPNAHMGDIENAIRRDPSLSYKILRTVNAAAFDLQREVQSIREALMLVGTRQLQNWISLLVMSGVNDKPRELITSALVRARMCELLGTKSGVAEAAFTVGLLSILDALLDVPMEDALQAMPLTATIREALLDRSGLLGMILKTALRQEAGDIPAAGIGIQPVQAAYLDALDWTSRLQEALEDPSAQSSR